MKYLNDYMEAAQTELLDDMGAFFAFSSEQFKEGAAKVGASKDNKVAQFQNGGYVLSKNRDELMSGLNSIHDKAIKQDIAENGIKNIIHRELANYETQINGDLEPAQEALKVYGITSYEVAIEYKEYFKYCCKHDLF